MVSVWMVFMPDPDRVSPGYLGFWLVLLYIGYTMMTIAHQSWGAELTSTYDDRSRLYGWRELFVIGGMALVLAIPAAVELLGSSESALKVASMGWFCLILFPLTALPTLLFVPDARSVADMAIDWKEAIKVILANRTLWRLLITDLTTGFASTASGVLYIFFATYVFELPEHASIALLFYFLASFAAMPAWLKIAYRFGKDRTIKIALLYGRDHQNRPLLCCRARQRTPPVGLHPHLRRGLRRRACPAALHDGRPHRRGCPAHREAARRTVLRAPDHHQQARQRHRRRHRARPDRAAVSDSRPERTTAKQQ